MVEVMILTKSRLASDMAMAILRGATGVLVLASGTSGAARPTARRRRCNRSMASLVLVECCPRVTRL